MKTIDEKTANQIRGDQKHKRDSDKKHDATPKERRSRSGRGREVRKDGAGPHSWGTGIESVPNGERRNSGRKNVGKPRFKKSAHEEPKYTAYEPSDSEDIAPEKRAPVTEVAENEEELYSKKVDYFSTAKSAVSIIEKVAVLAQDEQPIKLTYSSGIKAQERPNNRRPRNFSHRRPVHRGRNHSGSHARSEKSGDNKQAAEQSTGKIANEKQSERPRGVSRGPRRDSISSKKQVSAITVNQRDFPGL